MASKWRRGWIVAALCLIVLAPGRYAEAMDYGTFLNRNQSYRSAVQNAESLKDLSRIETQFYAFAARAREVWRDAARAESDAEKIVDFATDLTGDLAKGKVPDWKDGAEAVARITLEPSEIATEADGVIGSLKATRAMIREKRSELQREVQEQREDSKVEEELDKVLRDSLAEVEEAAGELATGGGNSELESGATAVDGILDKAQRRGDRQRRASDRQALESTVRGLAEAADQREEAERRSRRSEAERVGSDRAPASSGRTSEFEERAPGSNASGEVIGCNPGGNVCQ